MNNKQLTWILALLLVGTLVYHVSTVSTLRENNEKMIQEINRLQDKTAVPANSHVMPDGSIMSNDHSPAPSMAEMMHDMNASLEGKSGDELDKTFLAEMIVHHQGAVDMAQLILGSQHPELVKLGQDIITAQNKEIEMMKEWQKKWFNQE